MKKYFLSLMLLVNSLLALPGNSLYQLQAQWTNQQGEVKNFSELKNEKYKVITMIFTSCPAACPLMVSHLKQLDNELDAKQKQNVEYLLFSIDPLDSAEKLSEFHKKFGLDERFKFYKNQDVDQIQELAAVIDFKYKKIDENMYSHGTDVYLLDAQGVILQKVDQSYKSKKLASAIPR